MGFIFDRAKVIAIKKTRIKDARQHIQLSSLCEVVQFRELERLYAFSCWNKSQVKHARLRELILDFVYTPHTDTGEDLRRVEENRWIRRCLYFLKRNLMGSL